MSGHQRHSPLRGSPGPSFGTPGSSGKKILRKTGLGPRAIVKPTILGRSRKWCLGLLVVLGVVFFVAEMGHLSLEEKKSELAASWRGAAGGAAAGRLRADDGEVGAAIAVWVADEEEEEGDAGIAATIRKNARGGRKPARRAAGGGGADAPEDGGGGSADGDGVSGEEGGELSDKAREKAAKQLTNLNNLDMPMRKVGGKLEPCLKLLPPEDIERLSLPPPASASASPVKRLRYYHMDDDARVIEEDAGLADGHSGRTLDLDLFAGKQTMMERSESFRVQESKEVHCGFAAKATGFDIAANDQRWMKRCAVVVATCAFGGGDDLFQPIGYTNASLQKVCYTALWDDVTLSTQKAAGNVPDASGMIGLWRIVVVSNLPFVDQRRNGKVPKMLSHRLFPKARFSIWVDSKSQFRRDPLGVLEALLWRNKAVFAISEHGARSCIYKEGEAIVRKHKALPEEVAVQLNQYRSEGLPENASFDGHKALAEASIIVREHTTLTNLFMCLWFNEMARFTARDQLSFGYVLRRLGALKIHMFPVCTRRALVNSIGHKRKPKPLLRPPNTSK
eukprot:jgi/Mesen1/8042/ME000043S07430